MIALLTYALLCGVQGNRFATPTKTRRFAMHGSNKNKNGGKALNVDQRSENGRGKLTELALFWIIYFAVVAALVGWWFV